MSVTVIRSTPWARSPATGTHYRVVWVDACPVCRAPGAKAVHHLGQPTANCNECYVPFNCPPPSNDLRSSGSP